MAETVPQKPKVGDTSAVKDEDKKAQEALKISLVLRSVLSHFGAQKLMELSLVNKQWNYEARCILREFRRCVAYIGGPDPCVSAIRLNARLKKTLAIPFNALSISIPDSHKQCNRETENKTISEVYETLAKLQLKQVEIDRQGCVQQLSNQYNCVLGQLILRILLGCQNLERLVVKELPMSVTLNHLKAINQPLGSLTYFPRLTTIRIDSRCLDHKLLQDLLHQKAKQLGEIQCLPLLPWQEPRTVRRTGRQTTERLDLPTTDSRLQLLRSLIVLGPSRSSHPAQYCHRFCLNVAYLLHASSENLRLLHITPRSLGFMASKQRLPVCRSLTQLTIRLPAQSGGDTRVLDDSAAQLFVFEAAKYFPSVTEVFLDREGCLTDLGDPDYHPAADETFPWQKVETMRVRDVWSWRNTVQGVGQLLPALTSIEILEIREGTEKAHRQRGSYAMLSDLLSQFWPHLKELKMGTAAYRWSRGWSATSEYMNYDEEFLGMTRLRGLKRITVCIKINPFSLSGPGVTLANLGDLVALAEREQNYFLSTSTVATLQELATDLEFHLIAGSKETYKCLAHLKPWVKLELED